jgi:hypothetical protein
MQRRYELVDLIVAIGLFATILAGGLLFTAANGTLSVSPSRQSEREQPIGTPNGMQWLQPVLGQAILDQVLLERHQEKFMPAAVKRLNKVTGEHVRWQNSPFGYLNSIRTSAARAEIDHATRVQEVMGRAIVQFTQRGVRSGILSSDGDITDFNLRMIAAVNAMGRRIDAHFLASWQSNVGRAIVIAGQDGVMASAAMQERLGAAIVRLTTIRTTYEGIRAANQEQLGGATVVALQNDSQARFFGRDETHPPPGAAVAESTVWVWRELSTSTIVMASMILVGLFVGGLLLSPRLPRAGVTEAAKLKPAPLGSPLTV